MSYRQLLIMFFAILLMQANSYADDNQNWTRCSYEPSLGVPNPLGMRSFITVTERRGHTYFVYEQLPITLPEKIKMTTSTLRTLIMYDTPIVQARSLMRENLEYYNALIGYADSVGFATYDETLRCQTINPEVK